MGSLFTKKEEHNYIDKLSLEALKALAKLLRASSSPPPEEWLAIQREKIANDVPSELRRHGTSKLTVFLGIESFRKVKLCAAHAGLEPRLINFVFTKLRAEYTGRVHRLRAYRNRSWRECPDEIKVFLDRIFGIATLHMAPDDFDASFGSDVQPSCRFRRIYGGCAACQLAVVGARPELLSALRANMRSRSKTDREGGRRHHSPSSLLPLVEAWIDRLGQDKAAELRARSDALGNVLSECRREMAGRRERDKLRRTEEQLAEAARRKARRESNAHRGGVPAGETPYYDAGEAAQWLDPFQDSDFEESDEGSNEEASDEEEDEDTEEGAHVEQVRPAGDNFTVSALFAGLMSDVHKQVEDPFRRGVYRQSMNTDQDKQRLGRGKSDAGSRPPKSTWGRPSGRRQSYDESSSVSVHSYVAKSSVRRQSFVSISSVRTQSFVDTGKGKEPEKHVPDPIQYQDDWEPSRPSTADEQGAHYRDYRPVSQHHATREFYQPLQVEAAADSEVGRSCVGARAGWRQPKSEEARNSRQHHASSFYGDDQPARDNSQDRASGFYSKPCSADEEMLRASRRPSTVKRQNMVRSTAQTSVLPPDKQKHTGAAYAEMVGQQDQLYTDSVYSADDDDDENWPGGSGARLYEATVFPEDSASMCPRPGRRPSRPAKRRDSGNTTMTPFINHGRE